MSLHELLSVRGRDLQLGALSSTIPTPLEVIRSDAAAASSQNYVEEEEEEED
jgi:hypothetical protein